MNSSNNCLSTFELDKVSSQNDILNIRDRKKKLDPSSTEKS